VQYRTPVWLRSSC